MFVQHMTPLLHMVSNVAMMRVMPLMTMVNLILMLHTVLPMPMFMKQILMKQV